MTTRCVVCHAPTDLFLCQDDAQLLLQRLASLPAMLAELEVNLTRQDRLNGTGTSQNSQRLWIPPEGVTAYREVDEDGKPAVVLYYDDELPAHLRTSSGRVALPVTPWQIGWNASELLWAARADLSGWIRHLCEARGITPRRPVWDLASSGVWSDRDLCGWLVGAIDSIRLDEAAAELFGAVTAHLDQIAFLIDCRDEDQFVGICTEPDVRVDARPLVGPLCTGLEPCRHDSCVSIRSGVYDLYPVPGQCGAALYGRLNEPEVKCQACGIVYEVSERREEMLSHLPELMETVDIANALTLPREPVTPSMIRKMAYSGYIYPCGVSLAGVKLYRLADVRAVLDARRERKAAKLVRAVA